MNKISGIAGYPLNSDRQSSLQQIQHTQLFTIRETSFLNSTEYQIHQNSKTKVRGAHQGEADNHTGGTP